MVILYMASLECWLFFLFVSRCRAPRKRRSLAAKRRQWRTLCLYLTRWLLPLTIDHQALASLMNFRYYYYTSTNLWRGYIFTAVCLCVCLCMCPMFSCKQNFSQMDVPIWKRFSLNCCLQHWLQPYWNWWPLVKGQGHGDVIPIYFLHSSLLTSLLSTSALLWSIKMKLIFSLRYALGRFVYEFDKIRMDDVVIGMSFNFSANNCPYFKFY